MLRHSISPTIHCILKVIDVIQYASENKLLKLKNDKDYNEVFRRNFK